ncbi:MAG: CoA transferase [Synergistaceae bacterium]|nr:CoA transferase [Synergistaceae bacterium]
MIRGILDGVRVLGLEQQIAGPECTMMLADQGAEIIKIERPGSGDAAREMAPILKNEAGETTSGYFARFNRGKKSVTLNMRAEEAKEIIWKLLDKVDIVIENLKPGLMEKMGFTWEKIHERNPRLVYVAISGFGRSKKYEGPYSKRLAYDIIAQAMSGQMYACGGDPNGAPNWLGFAIGDTGTGVYAQVAALLGYINVLKTGVGEYFDIAMYDCMMALAERTHSIYAMTGKVTGRGPDKLVAPWGPFKCADGHVALMVPTEAMWKKFCTAIDHPELLEDSRLQSGPGRAAHLDVLMPVITDWLSDKTKEKATELFMAAGLPCAPVMSSEDCAKDSHTSARKMVVNISDPVMKEIKCIGSPFKMEEHEPVYGALPVLGGSTDEVLESLGYSQAEIAKFHEKEVV